MAYRGPALQYQIRKTTTKNRSGDNFAITIPRIVANQFDNIFFAISISGNTLIFTSGCKLTVSSASQESVKKIFTEGGQVIFR